MREGVRTCAAPSGPATASAYTPGVGDWYSIGLAAGIGTGLGVVLATFAGVARAAGAAAAAAVVAGAAGGAGIGLAIGEWDEAIGGAAGGVAGALAATQLVRGTLRRGGTRGGTVVLLAAAGIVVAALAFVPIVGYVEAALLPALGLRLRRRAGERYAGLRILARD